MALSLELINTFYLCALSDQLFNTIFIYVFFFLVTPCLVGVAQLCMKKKLNRKGEAQQNYHPIKELHSVHFSVDTGKYLFTKIYVLVNEMKCFLFLGGVMFRIF